jgi:hypothetical protein
MTQTPVARSYRPTGGTLRFRTAPMARIAVRFTSIAQRNCDRRGRVVPEAAPSESRLRVCHFTDDAETIAEWIAAKRNGRALSTVEFLLAFRASVQCVD